MEQLVPAELSLRLGDAQHLAEVRQPLRLAASCGSISQPLRHHPVERLACLSFDGHGDQSSRPSHERPEISLRGVTSTWQGDLVFGKGD